VEVDKGQQDDLPAIRPTEGTAQADPPGRCRGADPIWVFKEETMPVRLLRPTPVGTVLSAVAVLALAVPPAPAQFRLFSRHRPQYVPVVPCPCPAAPCPAPAEKPPVEKPPERPAPPPERPTPPPERPPERPPDLAPEQPPEAAPFEGTARAGVFGGATFAAATPTLIGDQLGIPALAFAPRPPFPPTPPGPAPGPTGPSSDLFVPSVRNFKIAENESPQPRDRVYFSFNYFDDVNKAVNFSSGAVLRDIRVYQENFGVEKTFLGGNASVGLRLPLFTVNADPGLSGRDGTGTDLGDLTVILKYAPWMNPDTGNLLSVGLAVTAPTGADSFAGLDGLPLVHSTFLQPFAGYIWTLGNCFVHGFTALDIPTDSDDVTVLYNDVGVGYFLYRSQAGDRLLTGITPTFEVHVSTPLNHRGALRTFDPAGTPDVVNLTMGTHFALGQRSVVTVGLATPVTGPRPFDLEVMAQLNIRFGRSVGRPGAFPVGTVVGN
jgi:hypothetical protein